MKLKANPQTAAALSQKNFAAVPTLALVLAAIFIIALKSPLQRDDC